MVNTQGYSLPQGADCHYQHTATARLVCLCVPEDRQWRRYKMPVVPSLAILRQRWLVSPFLLVPPVWTLAPAAASSAFPSARSEIGTLPPHPQVLC